MPETEKTVAGKSADSTSVGKKPAAKDGLGERYASSSRPP